MKRALPWFAVAALLPALASAQMQLPERYRQAGQLRWGSDAEGGAPFVYVDPSDPQREIGFEVEIAAAMGQALGVRMVRVQSNWGQLVQSLNRGDFDLILNGLEPTVERCKEVRFTRPYYLFQQQLAVAAGSTATTLDDCKGRRVGCLGQSASDLVLRAHGGGDIVVYEDPSRIYEEIENGRNFAGLADLPIALFYGGKRAGVQLAGTPFGEFFYAVAVRNGEADLQQALDACIARLLQDGELERIYRKWGMWNDAQQQLSLPRMQNLLHGELPGEAVAGADFAWAEAVRLLLLGALRTLGVSVAAFVLAVGLGLWLALTRLYGPLPLRLLAITYIEVFRGTPVLVQLLFLYYGLSQVEWLPRLHAWQIGVLGLGLNYAAYEAEIYRGAINGIPRGQTEAALALGFSLPGALRFVVLPQALRLSLSASTNDFIALFKDSAVVMVITVVELCKQYTMLASASGRYIALGFVTCGLYLAMSLPLAWCARRFEKSLDRDRT